MKILSLSAVFAAVSFTAPAHAETVNCTAITSLPYTITSQGVYCLTGHLSTGITSGNAITINASNVVFDLNGFKIGGLSAGLATQAFGIYAYQRQNITIYNGAVRGFFRGIWLEDIPPYTTSQGHVIEDIHADQNTVFGITVFGKGNIIRNNRVMATGGTTLYGTSAYVPAYGIVSHGPGARLLNNDVMQTVAQGTGDAYGIYVYVASNSVVTGNRIGNTIPSSASRFGIFLGGGSDLIVSENRLTGTQYGIYFYSGATGAYMNNLVRGANIPYTGGTAAVATNY